MFYFIWKVTFIWLQLFEVFVQSLVVYIFYSELPFYILYSFWGCGRLDFFLNNKFIQIQFTYHKIYPFNVYHPVVVELCNHHYCIYFKNIFITPERNHMLISHHS